MSSWASLLCERQCKTQLKIIIKNEPCDLYRISSNEGDQNVHDYEAIRQSLTNVVQNMNHLLDNNVNDEHVVINRNEVPMATIESHSVPKKCRKHKELSAFQ